MKEKRVCSHCGSTSEVWKYKDIDYFCKKHYHEMYHFGEIRNLNGKRKKNIIVIKDNHAEINFENGKIALIDIEDIDKLKKYYWGFNSQGYIHSRDKNKLIRLHLYLMNFPPCKVDHKNRNKLDNRKFNLRICTQNQNSKNVSLQKNNKSGFPGVYLIKSSGKWRASITFNRKTIHLGHYETFEKAVEARKWGEIEYFGDFAPNVDEDFRKWAKR